MRAWLTTAAESAGLVLILLGSWHFSAFLALIVLGLALLAVGVTQA